MENSSNNIRKYVKEMKRMRKYKSLIVFLIIFIFMVLVSSKSVSASDKIGYYGCPDNGMKIEIEINTTLYEGKNSTSKIRDLFEGESVTYYGEWTDNRMQVKVKNGDNYVTGWINLNSVPSVSERMFKNKTKKYLQLRKNAYGAPFLVDGLPVVYEETENSGDFYEYNIPIGATVRCLYVSGNNAYCEYNGYKGWIYSNAFMPNSLGNVGGAFESEKIYLNLSSSSGGGSGSSSSSSSSGSGSGSSANSSTSLSSNSNSQPRGDPSLGDLDNYAGGSSDSVKLQNMTGQILGIIQTIGTVIAVAMLIVIGIKYMLGSIEERAEYKQTLKPYLIGAFLVFSGTMVPQLIYQIAKNI